MLSLSQRQSLLQRLSPQQVQYLKMLQLPVLALEQRIKEEIELNPLLEEASEAVQDQESDLDQDTDLAPNDERSAPEPTADANDADGGAAETPAETTDRDGDFDWDEFTAGEYEGYKAPTFTGQEQEEMEESPQRAEESPADQLLAQLRMYNLSEDEIALAEEIIGNIDDHGYLLRELSDIVDDLNKFIAITSAATTAAEAAQRLGDGRFDSYEEVVVDEPFGRERLAARAAHDTIDATIVSPSSSDDGVAGIDDEEDRLDAAGTDETDDDGIDTDAFMRAPIGGDAGAGRRPQSIAELAAGGRRPAETPDNGAERRAQPGPGIGMMSLAEMSRLSIDELARLLEQGTSALTPPVPEAGVPRHDAKTNGHGAHSGAAATAEAGEETMAAAEGEAVDAAAETFAPLFTLAEAERVLHLIQRLDPPGIGARDLRECLLVQLEVHPDRTPQHELAERVLRDAYVEFTMKHFEKIIHRLGCTTEQLREAIDVVRTLNPKPGEGSASMAGNNYVTPDFVVERDGEDFVIVSNDRSLPTLRINRDYQDLIRRGDRSRANVDRGTRKFIREKFEAARWFIASIHQRRQTLLRVMRAIVDLQSDFFAAGPNFLRPMIYKNVAERIEMDISTVCRVVNGKYVQTDYGTYELRYFFSEKLETVDGDEVSTKVVRARIQELIEAEDKQHPLSDDAITQLMEEAGFHVARRTVAKYREQMNIPVARLRRSL